MRFPFELWRAQKRLGKGPPQPINVILTDMGTKKRPRESCKGERVGRWRGADETRYPGLDGVGTHLRQWGYTEGKQQLWNDHSKRKGSSLTEGTRSGGPLVQDVERQNDV